MSVPREVTQLIDSSGNTFHARIARWFRDNDWHVVVSPYYMDQTQAKAREIDIVTEKWWNISDTRERGHVVVRLFVECKYLSAFSVFWMADKNITLAEKLVHSTGPFRADNSYTRKHHYLLENSAAKLFATRGAGEQDPFYKALNQVLNGMVSLRPQPVIHPHVRDRHSCKRIMQYPVVVCNSFEKMFSVDFYNPGKPEQVTDNFQLEVQYAYTDASGNARAEYFLLDLVSEDGLDKFQQAVSDDAKAAARLLDV